MSYATAKTIAASEIPVIDIAALVSGDPAGSEARLASSSARVTSATGSAGAVAGIGVGFELPPHAATINRLRWMALRRTNTLRQRSSG